MSKEKLTDEQIIKSLELCVKFMRSKKEYSYEKCYCEECSFSKSEACGLVQTEQSLNLINRLKEENAELKAENERLKGISRGELIEVLNQEQKELQTILQTRKETAEKIYTFVNSFGTHNWVRFTKFIKQFGVEIKE